MQFRKLHTRYDRTKISHEGPAYDGSTMIITRTVFRSKRSVNTWKKIPGNLKPEEELYTIISEELQKYAKAINFGKFAI